MRTIHAHSYRMDLHARQRGAQRNITPEQMVFVADYGRRLYADGAIHCFLGRQETRRYAQTLGIRLDALEGICVVLSLTGTILTCFRNRDSMKYIRKKCA